jgi:hypothetical protein
MPRRGRLATPPQVRTATGLVPVWGRAGVGFVAQVGERLAGYLAVLGRLMDEEVGHDGWAPCRPLGVAQISDLAAGGDRSPMPG